MEAIGKLLWMLFVIFLVVIVYILAFTVGMELSESLQHKMKVYKLNKMLGRAAAAKTRVKGAKWTHCKVD